MTMQIKGLTIAGLPGIKVRNALRRMGSSEMSVQGIEKLFRVSAQDANLLIRELEEGGFLQSELHDGKAYYKLTSRGMSLANASAMKRMPHAKGDQLLRQVLGRAQEINTSNEYAFTIRTLVVYGSYVRKEATLGDLDIAVELQPKSQDSGNQAKAEEARTSSALASGRRFNNIVQELSWPRTEIYLHLKNRAKGLSLHDYSEFLRLAKEKLQYRVLIGNAEVVAEELAESAPAKMD
jgi:predicted nucleotidyltransferase